MKAFRPKVVDLFAGAGGLSLGFEQAGFDIAAAVELDPIHCATHEFNFPETPVVCGDASAITGDQIRSQADLGANRIDVVIGGAPCQGFSMIGKRALDDPRNQLVSHFARLVGELNASYFVFENVKGLTVGKHRQLLDEVVEEFDELGYNVLLPYRVLNAANYGVPQDRRRLFLLGAKRGLRLPIYPEIETLPAGTGMDDLVLPFGPSVNEAIGDLPDAEKYPELVENDSARMGLGKPSRYAAVLRGVVRDLRDFSHKRRVRHGIVTSSMRSEHTVASRKRFKATVHGETEPISRFHKLDPRGICNTIRAGTASDRGAFTSPRPIHPAYARCITVREAARLHSYPDWFRLHITKWHGFRQIGNSVPPLLARAVGKEIAAAMRYSPRMPSAQLQLGDESLLALNMASAASYYSVPGDTIAKRNRPNGPQRAQDAGGATAYG